MPRYKQYTLSEDELRAIHRVIREEKRAKVVRRATALRLLHEGHAPAVVAEVVQVSEATVYNWHRRWIEEGIGGLVPHAPPGRRVRAEASYWQAIETALESDPEALGYSFTIWTVERLRDHVEQVTGVQLSVGYLGEQLKARGYVYRRPKQDLRVHQDPAARAEAEARLDELKKKPNKAILSSSLWTKAP